MIGYYLAKLCRLILQSDLNVWAREMAAILLEKLVLKGVDHFG